MTLISCRLTLEFQNGMTQSTGTCINAGYENNSVITYGNIPIYENSKLGDAYDCDVNGDGKVDKTDCAEVLRQFYGYTSYKGVKKKASDTNGDGKIDKLDASQILRQFYGYAEINQ